MKELRLSIRVNAQAQAGTTMLSTGTNEESVELIFDKTKRRVFAYVGEDVSPQNLLGFVKMATIISDDGEEAVTNDTVVDVIAKGYTATAIHCEDKEIIVSVIPEEKVVKDNKNSIEDLSAEIKETMNKIVENGILTENECLTRYNYLTDLSYTRVPLPKDLLLNIFSFILDNGKRNVGSVITPRTLYKDKYDFVSEYKDKSIIAICLNKTLIGQHTMYVGDKSVGKTVMVETVNWVLNKPMQRVQANDKVTEETLFGMKTTAPAEIMKFSEEEAINASYLALKFQSGEKLNAEELDLVARWNAAKARSQAPMIIQEPGPLTLALTLNGTGCTLNVEEANMLQPNAMAVLNNCNDGSKFVQTSSGQLKIGTAYTFMGTQNEGKSYTGTNKQNTASMSRLSFIRFPYNKTIKDILEVSVSDKVRERLSSGYFEACDKFYIGIMNAYNKPTPLVSDDCLNIRGLKRALEEVASVNIGTDKKFIPMVSLREAIKTNVVDVSERDKDNELINRLLESISDKL